MTDPDDDADREQFSIAVFYRDGGWHYIARWIDGKTAVREFRATCESPPARAGLFARIIATDGGDFTVLEWQHGVGYTFPPELVERTGGPRQ